MKNILCYGDSNTYGLKSDLVSRYERHERWTGWITTDKRLLSLIQEYGLTRAEEERAYYESLISNQLTELAGMSASIQDIVLLLEDGRVFRSVFIEDSDVERILSSDWYRKQEEENYLKFFYPDGPGDSFPKIIVRHDIRKRWYDENGVLNIGVIDFLLDDTVI